MQALERALVARLRARACARGTGARDRRRRASRRRASRRARRGRARRARAARSARRAARPRRWRRRTPARAPSSLASTARRSQSASSVGNSPAARATTSNARARVVAASSRGRRRGAVEREAVLARGRRRDEHLEHLGLALRGARLVVGALEDRRRARARLGRSRGAARRPRWRRGSFGDELERALARRERVDVRFAADRRRASRARPRARRARRPRADRDRAR